MLLLTEERPHERSVLFLSHCTCVFSDLMGFVVLFHVFLLMCHPESILHGRQDSVDSCHHPWRPEGGQCGGWVVQPQRQAGWRQGGHDQPGDVFCCEYFYRHLIKQTEKYSSSSWPHFMAESKCPDLTVFVDSQTLQVCPREVHKGPQVHFLQTFRESALGADFRLSDFTDIISNNTLQ